MGQGYLLARNVFLNSPFLFFSFHRVTFSMRILMLIKFIIALIGNRLHRLTIFYRKPAKNFSGIEDIEIEKD